MVDALGTWCPVPVHLIARAAATCRPGDLIDLLADDPLIAVDLPAWCHTAGHELVGLVHEDDEYRGRVRIGGHPHQEDDR